jgi:hypothetical protein
MANFRCTTPLNILNLTENGIENIEAVFRMGNSVQTTISVQNVEGVNWVWWGCVTLNMTGLAKI